jgi:hypothetical protein
MNILYGIDPNLCIEKPNLVTEYQKDIILPQYFYTQLHYLKERNLNEATISAQKIINSLSDISQSELLIFQNQKGGLVYFINESIVGNNWGEDANNLDHSTPLIKYFLSLKEIAQILQAEVYFCLDSLARKDELATLRFILQTVEEFCHESKSWLQPEIILGIQDQLVPPIVDSEPPILWEEDKSNNSPHKEVFIWMDRGSQ